MPVPSPTSAPPNFYDNLPAGGDAAAGSPAPKKSGESDADGEVLKALTGVYRVLGKVGKIKKELKPGIDSIKEEVKKLVVQGLKKDPGMLDSGEDSSASGGETPAAPDSGSAGAPPSQTDETHQA